jgi:hypothetical protein
LQRILLSRDRQLKDSKKYKGVFIRASLTKEQREK